MVIHTHWHDDSRRVVVCEFAEDWNWNDFHAAFREAHRLIAGVPHPVDLLMIHHIDQPPGNPMVHFGKAAEHQPPNTGKVVIVNPRINPGVRNFMIVMRRILDRVYPARSEVLLVETLTEAYRLLDIPQPAASSGA